MVSYYLCWIVVILDPHLAEEKREEARAAQKKSVIELVRSTETMVAASRAARKEAHRRRIEEMRRIHELEMAVLCAEKQQRAAKREQERRELRERADASARKIAAELAAEA